MNTKAHLTSPASLITGARVGFCLLLAGVSPVLADMNDHTTPPRDSTSPTAPNNGSGTNNGSAMTGQTGNTLGQTPPAPARELSRVDRRFFRKAAELGEHELAYSRAATRHATDPRVRSFAEEMVRAHEKMNQEVAALARDKGVVIEERDATERRAEDKEWAEKKAGAFDKDYVDEMIDAHEDTIDVLENGAESDDAEISALARRLLPTVKAHLARAEALEDAMD